MVEISTEVGTEGEGGCTTFLVSMSLIIFFDRNTHASVSSDILSLSILHVVSVLQLSSVYSVCSNDCFVVATTKIDYMNYY